MLLDQARDLRAALDRHRELKKAGAKAAIFRTRAGQFAPLATELQGAEILRRALNSEGVQTAAPTPVPQTRQQAQSLLAKFRDDRDSVADADSSIRFEFSSSLKAAIAASKKDLTEAWRAMAESKADTASLDQVLIALGSLPSYATAVARIRQLDAVIVGLRDSTPTAGEVRLKLDALNAAVDARSRAIEAIEGGDLPADVLAFLRKVAQGGAVLNDFTAEVKDWLIARNLLGGFRIVPQRSSSQ